MKIDPIAAHNRMFPGSLDACMMLVTLAAKCRRRLPLPNRLGVVIG